MSDVINDLKNKFQPAAVTTYAQPGITQPDATRGKRLDSQISQKSKRRMIQFCFEMLGSQPQLTQDEINQW